MHLHPCTPGKSFGLGCFKRFFFLLSVFILSAAPTVRAHGFGVTAEYTAPNAPPCFSLGCRCTDMHLQVGTQFFLPFFPLKKKHSPRTRRKKKQKKTFIRMRIARHFCFFALNATSISSFLLLFSFLNHSVFLKLNNKVKEI